MQPTAQPRLRPMRDDIRQLRADQEFVGVAGCFGLIILKPLGCPSLLECELPYLQVALRSLLIRGERRW
jgi:hypothetical protein